VSAPPRITPVQRDMILQRLRSGFDRDVIATEVGVTVAQVSAVAAHVRMGTYDGREDTSRVNLDESLRDNASRDERAAEDISAPRIRPILLGNAEQGGTPVYWNPDPVTGSANPHILILGETGYGKTYTICCMLAELAQQNVPSIVFDYGQGFSLRATPDAFSYYAHSAEVEASREGIDLNPLQIFSSDMYGPVNVAQRIADTFTRVYPQIGIQQHATLRQAVLDVFADSGIRGDVPGSWKGDTPSFDLLRQHLEFHANKSDSARRRLAQSVSSHISTLFVFNTLRPGGRKLTWSEIIKGPGCVILQLAGLESSLEAIVTEFLLWNLVGFVEALGPGPLRCFVVLDEAHKLSFDRGSPTEKLLREGRKFGVGVVLASQQPEDFSAVAFANTATKLVFQVADDRFAVSKRLQRKLAYGRSIENLSATVTGLPRGSAYVMSDKVRGVVRITDFEARASKWK